MPASFASKQRESHLTLNGNPPRFSSGGNRSNKASDNRTGLTGDEIFAAFSRKNCFGPRWVHFDAGVQWSIIEAVAEEEDPVRLHESLMTAHGVTAEQANVVGRIRLPEGHGRLGETATRLIVE